MSQNSFWYLGYQDTPLFPRLLECSLNCLKKKKNLVVGRLVRGLENLIKMLFQLSTELKLEQTYTQTPKQLLQQQNLWMKYDFLIQELSVHHTTSPLATPTLLIIMACLGRKHLDKKINTGHYTTLFNIWQSRTLNKSKTGFLEQMT